MIDNDLVENYLTDNQLEDFKEFNPKKMEALSDWDNIPNIQIALYLILVNPNPRQKVSSDTKRKSILKLKQSMLIRKTKTDLKTKELEWYSGYEPNDYSPYAEVIIGNLGKYGKYFIPEPQIPFESDKNWKSKINEHRKENIVLDKPRYMVNEKDELKVLKEFFDEVELYKAQIISKYSEHKKFNHNNTGEMKRKNIDDKLKDILKKRLSEIKTSDTKITTLSSKAIKAIKAELLSKQ